MYGRREGRKKERIKNPGKLSRTRVFWTFLCAVDICSKFCAPQQGNYCTLVPVVMLESKKLIRTLQTLVHHSLIKGDLHN